MGICSCSSYCATSRLRLLSGYPQLPMYSTIYPWLTSLACLASVAIRANGKGSQADDNSAPLGVNHRQLSAWPWWLAVQ